MRPRSFGGHHWFTAPRCLTGCTDPSVSDPNPWVAARDVCAFGRDVRCVRFAVVVLVLGMLVAPAVAPGAGSVPGGAVVGGDVVVGGYPPRVVGRFCSLVSTMVSNPSSGGGRRVSADFRAADLGEIAARVGCQICCPSRYLSW